jgi:hypothetical protein
LLACFEEPSRSQEKVAHALGGDRLAQSVAALAVDRERTHGVLAGLAQAPLGGEHEAQVPQRTRFPVAETDLAVEFERPLVESACLREAAAGENEIAEVERDAGLQRAIAARTADHQRAVVEFPRLARASLDLAPDGQAAHRRGLRARIADRLREGDLFEGECCGLFEARRVSEDAPELAHGETAQMPVAGGSSEALGLARTLLLTRANAHRVKRPRQAQ